MVAGSSPEGSLTAGIADFLADLAHAGRSPHTRRAYAADLAQFASFSPGPLNEITAASLRAFFATTVHLGPATRARKQAALASFLAWAYRQERIAANPIDKIERVQRTPPHPRGVGRKVAEAVLAVIPADKKRDRLLFRLLLETGLRISEALALHVEDLDLTADDEQLRVVGKGGKRRTVLLEERGLVLQLRAYLKQTGYRHGPLFRAEKNGRGGALRYQAPD